MSQIKTISWKAPRVKKDDKLHGIKIPSTAGSPRAQLITLLQLAAEVEHGLLLQYLYAAYSVSSAAANSDLQRQVLIVARQEMGHLLTVQNLLLAVGGIAAVHLHKNHIRPQSDLAIPFSLEPMTIELLAKYVAVESPIDVPADFSADVAAIFARVKGAEKLIPHPVGGLYTQIFWILQPSNEAVTDLMPLSPNSELKPGNHITDWNDPDVKKTDGNFEAERSAWDSAGSSAVSSGGLILDTIITQRQALVMVNAIAEQGEGTGVDPGNISHFEAFLAQYKKFQQNGVDAIKLPVNPSQPGSTFFADPTFITNPYSLLWISLSDRVYTSMLLDIYSSISLKANGNFDNGAIISLVFDNMRGLIKMLFPIIYKLPLLAGAFTYDQEPRCGMTFATDPDFDPVSDVANLQDQHRAFIANINADIAAIKAHADFGSHSQADIGDNGDCSILFDLIQTYIQNKTNSLKL